MLPRTKDHGYIYMKFCTIDRADMVPKCVKNVWNWLAWGDLAHRYLRYSPIYALVTAHHFYGLYTLTFN
jgi:hypothetical protein